MNTQYFINKFQATPEEKWCTGRLENEEGQHCANGHCGVDSVRNIIYTGGFSIIVSCETVFTEESKAFQKVISRLDISPSTGFEMNYDLKIEDQEYSVKAAIINNGHSSKYQQRTPKQRILAALNDILLLEEQDKAVERTNKLLSQSLELV